MVEREDLEALDFLLWHGKGQLAATALGCHQATVSRRLSRCRRIFRLRLCRQEGEWQCAPNALLDLERHVHQLGRFLGRAPLRIEGFPIGSASLLQPQPPGWIVGSCDHIGVDRPLQLLRQRVIDAWLCDADQDLPGEALADLAVLPLWRAPVQLVGRAGHPLAGERGLTSADLLRFPSLDLPAEGYLRSRELFRAQGFGDQPHAMRRYDLISWQEMTADQVLLTCSTPLNRLVGPAVVLLDAPPLFWNGGALVVRLDQADQPAVSALETRLRQRFVELTTSLPDCVPC